MGRDVRPLGAGREPGCKAGLMLIYFCGKLTFTQRCATTSSTSAAAGSFGRSPHRSIRTQLRRTTPRSSTQLSAAATTCTTSFVFTLGARGLQPQSAHMLTLHCITMLWSVRRSINDSSASKSSCVECAPNKTDFLQAVRLNHHPRPHTHPRPGCLAAACTGESRDRRKPRMTIWTIWTI